MPLSSATASSSKNAQPTLDRAMGKSVPKTNDLPECVFLEPSDLQRLLTNTSLALYSIVDWLQGLKMAGLRISDLQLALRAPGKEKGARFVRDAKTDKPITLLLWGRVAGNYLLRSRGNYEQYGLNITEPVIACSYIDTVNSVKAALEALVNGRVDLNLRGGNDIAFKRYHREMDDEQQYEHFPEVYDYSQGGDFNACPKLEDISTISTNSLVAVTCSVRVYDQAGLSVQPTSPGASGAAEPPSPKKKGKSAAGSKAYGCRFEMTGICPKLEILVAMSDNMHPSPTNPAKQSSPPAPSFLFGAPAPFSAAASSSGSRKGSPSKANPSASRAATPAATSTSAAQASSKTRTSPSTGKARTSDSFNREPWHVEPDSWLLERADLKSKLANAKEEIQEKDRQLSDLRTRVGNQQKDVAALNKKVADLENDVKVRVDGIAGAVGVIGSSVKALADLDVPPAEEAASVLRDVVLIQHLNLTNLHSGLGGNERERPSLKEEWRAEAGAEMEE
ncbi:hypothetical protein JCM8097_007287 [Rhodosporidiobolus ruineniae]